MSDGHRKSSQETLHNPRHPFYGVAMFAEHICSAKANQCLLRPRSTPVTRLICPLYDFFEPHLPDPIEPTREVEKEKKTPPPKPESISDAGLDLIKEFESLEKKPYNDPVGHCTIGYGHLLHKGNCTQEDLKKYPDGISEKEAKKLLEKDTKTAQDAVKELITVDLNQGQFDALVSFTFNLGYGSLRDSTLRTLLNEGKYDAVPGELNKWVNGTVKGKLVKLKGLVRRRKKEGELFSGSAQ